MITHLVGLSLGSTSSVESGVAVREVTTGKIIYLDKLFSMNDITFFFEHYNNLQNSVCCISMAYDITMMDGKWRVLSKPYQFIHNNENFPNKDNWMQRFTPRGSELFLNLKEEGYDINRFDIYQARQKLNLYSNYKERSSADCKFLQSILKTEYGFECLPGNMVPAAQLEAIIGTLIAEKKLKKQTSKIFEFKGLDVINLL